MFKILSTSYAKVHRSIVFVERTFPDGRPPEVWQVGLEIDVDALVKDAGLSAITNKTHRSGLGGGAVVARAKRER